MTDDVRNVREALSTIHEHWQPHRLTSVNDYDVKVVKLQGEFVWHTHPETDELFFVVSGRLTIQLRDRDVVLNPNDVFVVPRGSSTARKPRKRCRRSSSSRRARSTPETQAAT